VTTRPGTRKSLRSRWNRAFATLTFVLVAGGLVGVAGTRVVVRSYRDTAYRLEAEAGNLARLRADLVGHALLTASFAGPEADAPAQARLDSSVRARFAVALAGSDDATRELFRRADVLWRAFVGDAARAAGSGDPVQARAKLVGTVVATEVPKVLTLLDDAGVASRAAARTTLARNAGVMRVALTGWLAVSLLAFGLMIRLARRLSSEVLQPVGRLRDSANLLAGGDLSHRVRVSRDDELGDLATSFNAMADAIAGNERMLSRQANHDSLTGLANRAGFRTRADDALARPDRRDGTQAVLFVDLDDFKDVNDLLGHAAGDDLLRVVAARLAAVVRTGDLVARLGGDEFAVLLDGVPDAGAAYRLAVRAVDALKAPVEIGGTHVHVGASIGLAMRRDSSDIDDLMREADVAMYAAKALGKCRVERYDPVLGGVA
jgi:diguanylate cyclase (GGDEF)-like protein